MNQGFYNFPNASDPNLLDIKEFDTVAVHTYKIPEGTKLIQIIAVGGGGGGGSGRCRASGTAASGGGGGGGGGTVIHTFLREQIPTSTLLVVPGPGGTGANSRPTTTVINGLIGGTGVPTRIFVRDPGIQIPPINSNITIGNSLNQYELNGLLLQAPGGGGGAAGSTIAASGGAGRICMSNGNYSSGALTTGATSPNSNLSTSLITITHPFNKGGAGGGGATTGGSLGSGGPITVSITPFFSNPDYSATILSPSGQNATANASSSFGYVMLPYMGGIGGPGGGAGNNASIALGRGGNGWRGGGGGGGGTNLQAAGGLGNTGGGGNGGDGYVAIFCYK